MEYPMPHGMHSIPDHLLDLRPDDEIDHDIQHPKPITSEKNIWFFWHQGFTHMHPYTQRNVRAYHRRFSRQGWTIRVLDRDPDSPLNVAHFLDVKDPNIFPKAFVEGAIGGTYGVQHTSDLVRWPLLLKYGGVYADAGFMQIGDLDRMWHETVGSPGSPYTVLSYNAGDVQERDLTNYFLCSRPDNPLFSRCHRLLLELWNADGGKTSTDGMHASPLLKGLRLQGADGGLSFEEDGKVFTDDEVARMLTDYIIQGQVMHMVMGLVDKEDEWNGPEYVAKHVYAIDYMVGSQLINEYTAWNGPEAYRLMSLALPRSGQAENEDQKKAREIVEGCLSRSFGFKLAHGLILRVIGDTLGSLWRKYPGSDDVPGTYAHWLRQGMIYWTQDELPPRQDWKPIAPYKEGPLLRES